jgi:hypothetical protein
MHRQVTSLVVLFAATVMMLTGLVMFLVPEHGGSGYFLGLDRRQYTELHLTFMVPFILGVVLHIIWNWKAILAYFRSRPEKPSRRGAGIAIAAGIAVVFFAGTVAKMAPFTTFVEWGRSISHGGAEGGPGGPGGEMGRFGPGGPVDDDD